MTIGKRVPASSVGPLLDAVVGETSPVGETLEDDRRMLNVPAFSEVCEWVLGRVGDAQAAAGSPEGSVRALAEAVLDAAGVLHGHVGPGTGEGE